jgi:hypothetical protein
MELDEQMNLSVIHQALKTSKPFSGRVAMEQGNVAVALQGEDKLVLSKKGEWSMIPAPTSDYLKAVNDSAMRAGLRTSFVPSIGTATLTVKISPTALILLKKDGTFEHQALETAVSESVVQPRLLRRS